MMTSRLFTGRTNPAKGKDTELMQTINRIIGNTIEQSVIFAGLFGNILFDVDKNGLEEFGENKVLVLASLFVICRVWFAIGYLLGHFTGYTPFRSGGFTLNLLLNVVMMAYCMGYNVFDLVETYSPVETLDLMK